MQFDVDNHVFGYRLLCFFGVCDYDFNEQCNRRDICVNSDEVLFLDHITSDCGVTSSPASRDGILIVRINFIPRTIDQYAILQHEIFHVVEFIFEEYDIPKSEDTSEAFAQLIQYYTREIYVQIKKAERSNKNIHAIKRLEDCTGAINSYQ